MIDPGEERRARLLAEQDIPDLLARALDQVPDAWEVLWVQRELLRLGDPEKLKGAGKSRTGEGRRSLLFEAARADSLLAYLKDRDLGFDFAKGWLTIPTGGRPRTLIRSLVGVLDSELDKERPKLKPKEKITRMAPLLRPFFGSRIDDLGSRGFLARTLGNV